MGTVGGAADEIRHFLTTRRGRLTPDQVGLAHPGGRRRVSGLRREEVALLAGISLEYYTRLERGNARGVSDSVVGALARALRLDDVERAHLIDLVRIANATPAMAVPQASVTQVRPQLQQLLDAMSGTAAFLRNARLDILAVNTLGRALYAPVLDNASRPANLARFIFLDPAPRTSTAIGMASAGPRSAAYAPKPASTPTTGHSRNWLANCRPAVRYFGPCGTPMTSATTAPVANRFTTLWWATSTSTTTRWRSPQIPV
jgi:hypothetical protein